jgi:hypothetical protein
MKLAAGISLAVISLATAQGALPSSTGTVEANYTRYYVDELKIGNAIEEDGIRWNSRRRAIDTASCMGLRRYGVRTSAYGLDKYWRFKCDLIGADDHWYTAQVSTTNGPKPGYWYWHVLSIRRDF